MLKEFWVDNYKTLVNVAVKPRRLNLLLGRNNSGKTNLSQALRFAATTAAASLNDCADQIAGTKTAIGNLSLDKDTVDFRIRAELLFHGQPLDFKYELSVALPTGSNLYPALRLRSEKLTCEEFPGAALLEVQAGEARILDEELSLGGELRIDRAKAPDDSTMLCQLYAKESNVRLSAFKQYLLNWQYYDLSALVLKASTLRSDRPLLDVQGGNLASLIYQLKTGNELEYRKFLRLAKSIEPMIEVINFQQVENHIFMMFQDSQGNSLPASIASNGTMRYLALIYLLAIQEMKKPQLILIEEPENGIYVGFLKELLERAKDPDDLRQFFFTSHSPYFIDLFDDQLEGIFLMRKSGMLTTISQPDPQTIQRRLEDFPLGEQHFREMLA